MCCCDFQRRKIQNESLLLMKAVFMQLKSEIGVICGMSLYSNCLSLLCDSVFMNNQGPNKYGAVESPRTVFVRIRVIDWM